MRIVLLATALAIAAGGYTTYWFVIRAHAADAVEEWIAAQRLAGTEITYRHFEIGGFPYRLEAEVEGLSVARGGGAMPWAWRSERVRLIAQPWDLTHLVAVTEAPSELTYRFAGVEHRVTVDLSEGRASARIRGDGEIGRGGIDLRDLRLADGVDGAPLGSAGRLQVHVRKDGETVPDAVDAVLQADDVELPGSGPAALGDRLERVLVDATWTGPLPDADFARAMAAWRDAGGALDIRALDIAWGPLAIEGDATLSLDAAMRPLGAGVVRVAGSDSLLDALAAEGSLDKTAAAAAKIALALVARRPPDGGAPVVEAPVTVQDGVVTLGPVPVARVGPLTGIESTE